MKKILVIVLQFFAISMLAQTPQLINYQGIARDGNGNAVRNKTIAIRFEFRQGSVSSPTVFTETQSVGTGNLGVFSTQIGKVNTSGLAQINWQSGSMFLEVSIDTTNGTNFISLGAQQLVSVPYAMLAQTVPSTFTNNVLTIGSGVGASVYTLSSTGSSPTVSLTTSGGGASVTSSGTNTFNIDVPLTSISGGTNVNVQGTHPNYTINATPSLSINGNNLSISGGNVVTIPTSGTIAAVTTSIVSSGAANTTLLGPNSFSIDVPVPTFTNTGQNIITGTYPNFTVNTPTVTAGSNATLVASGAAVNTTVAPNSYSIHVPPTSVVVTNSAATLSVTNVGTNSVSINIPPSSTPTITQGGVLTQTTSGSSFTLAVAPSSIVVTSTVGAAGVSTTSPNNFNINIPPSSTPTITQGGVLTQTTSGSSFTLAVAPSSIAVTSTVGAAGVSTTSPNNFNINIPPSSNPTVVASGAAVNTTVAPNSYSIHVPPTDVAVTSTGSALGVTNVGTNSVSINVPTVLITSSTNVNVTGAYPSYTIASAPTLSISGNFLSISGGNGVTIPATGTVVALTTSITGGGAASVFTLGANDYSIHVNPATFTPNGPVNITGTYPNFTVNSSTGTTYTNGAGISITSGSIITNTSPDVPVTFTNAGPTTISGTYPNFTVNSSTGTTYTNGAGISITSGSIITNTSPDVPVTFTNAGPTTISGTYPNFTVNSSAAAAQSLSIGGGSITISGGNSVLLPTTPNTTITPGGIANVTNPATNSFVVSVPNPTLTLNTNSLSINGGNTVVIPAAVSQTLVPQGAVTVTNGVNSFTVSAPAQVAQTITPQGIASVTNGVNSATVSVPNPTLTLNTNSLSINGGNTVVIPSAVSQTLVPQGAVTVTNGVNSFTVSAPAQVAQTITPQGIASVTNGVNSATVSVPNPTLTLNTNSLSINGGNTVVIPAAVAQTLVPQGAVTVTNGVNSFTISAPAQVAQTITPQGIASVTNGVNSATVSVPNPTLTLNTNSLSINGGNTVVIPAAVSQTLVPQGAVTVTNGVNSFTVSAPAQVAQTITPQGIASVTNGVNSATVSVPNPTLTLNTNSLSINGGNTVVIPAAVSQTLVPQGAVTVTNGVNSFTVSAPAQVAQTITPQGIASVTNGVNSATVSVPNPTLTLNTNSLSINGGNTVVIPAQVAQTITPQGIASVTNGVNSATVSVPNPTLTLNTNSLSINGGNTVVIPAAVSQTLVPQGAVTVTNGVNSFTVSAPAQVAQTITPQGIASVTNGVNSATVSVPAPTLSVGGGSITISGGNSVLLPSDPTVSGAGIASVSAGPNYVVGVQTPVFTNVTQNIITGSYPNYSVNTPTIANTDIALTSSAAAGPSISTIGTNSFNINIPPANQPTFAYSQTTGSLTSGTSSAYITPNLTFSNGVITSGPSTNSIAINSGTNAAWSTLGNVGTNTVSNFIGTTDNVPLFFRVNNIQAGRIDHLFANAFFGKLSGGSNTSGASNAGFADEALRSNTSGSYNTGIGQGALNSNTTGDFNTAIGMQSLFSNSNGSLNVGLGSRAGFSNVSGSGNVFIGYQAGFYETGSNKLWIANSTNSNTPLVYGDFANGRLSVNTTTSTEALNVGGNVRFSGALMPNNAAGTSGQYLVSAGAGAPPVWTSIGSGTAAAWSTLGNSGTVPGTNYLGTSDNLDLVFKTNATERMRLDNLGRFGIGSTAMTEMFQIENTTNATMSMLSGAGSTSNLYFGIAGGFHFNGNIQYNNSNNSMNFWTNNTSNRLVILSNGNIGIGTTASNAPLQFNQTISGRKIVLWELANNDNQVYGFGLSSDILRYQVDASTANHVFYAGINSGSSRELMRITGAGRVGIGIAAPSTTFAIGNGTTEKFNIDGTNGDMNFLDDQASITFPATTTTAQPMVYMFNTGTNNPDRMVISHGPSNPTWGLQYQDVGDKFNFLRVGSPVLSIDLGAGNVGVGTSSPNFYSATGRFLSVSSTSVYANVPAVLELQGSSTGGEVAKIDFSSLFTTGSPTNTARIALLNNGNIYRGELAFSTHDGTSLGEAMRIDDAGRIGVGTNNPAYLFHVNKDDSGILAYFDNNSQGSGEGLRADVATTATTTGTRFGLRTTVSNGLSTGYGLYSIVAGNASNNIGVYASGTGGTYAYGVYGQASGGSVESWAGYFAGNGNVTGDLSVGHLAVPAYGLDVKHNGTSWISEFENTNTGIGADGIKISVNAVTPSTGAAWLGFYSNGGSSYEGGITANGLGTAVQYLTTSDGRLKQNITPFENTLEIISKIEPKKYEYKKAPGTVNYGFIAQELQKVYPMAVSGTPDSDVTTNPMMVDYSKLTPLLTGGVKELYELVKKQNEQIELMKKQIEELQKK